MVLLVVVLCGNKLFDKSMKTKLFLFLILLLVQSCMLNEDELTKKRVPYYGKEFKIDGCYYYSTLDGSCDYLFFYSNGVLLSFNDSCNIISPLQFKALKFNLRIYWSIFQVEGKTITNTYWDAQKVSLSSVGTSSRFYKIENDTTLLYSYNNNNFYYHFKHFNPKPDSTNIFIK